MTDSYVNKEYVVRLEAERDALRARIEDVDTLTDKLFANFYPATLSRCRVVAEYLSKWLKEG